MIIKSVTNEKWHVGSICDSMSIKCTSKRDISKFLTIRHHCFNHSPVWATVHVFSVIFLQHHMSSIEWTSGQLTSSEVLQCNTEVIFWYTQDKHHPTEQRIKIQNLWQINLANDDDWCYNKLTVSLAIPLWKVIPL